MRILEIYLLSYFLAWLPWRTAYSVAELCLFSLFLSFPPSPTFPLSVFPLPLSSPPSKPCAASASLFPLLQHCFFLLSLSLSPPLLFSPPPSALHPSFPLLSHPHFRAHFPCLIFHSSIFSLNILLILAVLSDLVLF